MNEQELEQAIITAAETNADNLDDLIQQAIERMDEEKAGHLLDRVTQILSERLRDARGWK